MPRSSFPLPVCTEVEDYPPIPGVPAASGARFNGTLVLNRTLVFA
ncbi:hypothetical protein [Polaromonas aquatica]